MGIIATRRERVVLDLESNIALQAAKDAAAIKMLNHEIKSLSGNAVSSRSASRDLGDGFDRVGKSSRSAGHDVEDFSRKSEKAGASIDKLSGRVRILADVAAILGPGLIPVGAVGIPAVAGLASQMGFAALAGGTMIAAFQGVGTALTAVNKAGLEPTAANIEAARVAMEKIGPSARAFVKELASLGPALSAIKETAGAEMFPGFTKGIDALQKRLPDVQRIVGAVAGELGSIGEATGKSLASARWDDFFKFLATEAPKSLGDMASAVGNVTHAMAELWMAFQPLNNDFGSWLVDSTKGLDDWAMKLGQTNGFQEFIDYIKATGPQVEQTFAAIGNAVLQIVEAAAPLGGPVLQGLEAVAKVIAAVADSDIGTPIFTALSALALYNRALAVTGSLSKTAFSTAGVKTQAAGLKSKVLEVGGIRAAYREAAVASAELARADQARAQAAIHARDAQFALVSPGAKRGAVTDYVSAGKAQAAAAERVAAAEKTKSAALREGAFTAGKAGASMAGLALATTGAGDSMGVTNTVALGLAGTMFGPVGTAAGVAVGAILDLSAAGAKGTEAITAMNAAMRSGDSSKMVSAFKELNKQVDDWQHHNFKSPGDILGDIGTDINRTFHGDPFGNKFKQAPIDGRGAIAGNAAFGAGAKAAEMLGVKNRLAAQGLQLTAAAAKEAAGGVNGFARAATLATAAISKQGSLDAYRSSLLAFNDALKQNGKTLSVSTKEGLANRAGLRDIASNALQAASALKNVDVKDKFLDNARSGFIKSAVAAGATRAAARRLANEFGLVDRIKASPKVQEKGSAESRKRVSGLRSEIRALRGKIVDAKEKGAKESSPRVRALREEIQRLKGKVVVAKQTGANRGPVDGLRQSIDSLHSKTVTVTVNRVGGAAFNAGAGFLPRADGGEVPGPRYPYADKIHAILAPGEEVITNRNGEADRYRRDRAAGRIPAYADGGTVQRLASGGKVKRKKVKPSPNYLTKAERVRANKGFDIGTLDVKGTQRELNQFAATIRKSGGHVNRDFGRLSKQILANATQYERNTKAISALKDKQTSAREAGVGAFNNNIFGGSLADLKTQLEADRNDAHSSAYALYSARKRGLTGDLAAGLAGSGNAALAQEFAQMSASQIASYQSLYASRTAAQNSLGSQGAASYTAEINALNKTNQQLTATLNRLEHAVERGAKNGVAGHKRATTAKHKARG